MSKFIINLFGESGAGKSTVLLQLIEMLRKQSKYFMEVRDNFKTRDCRSMMWCRSGQKYSGAVSVCTMGDTEPILLDNLKFFDRLFDPKNLASPWNTWEDVTARKVSKQERANLRDDKIGVLVTASHKPLVCYKKLSNVITSKGYKVVNIPVRVDFWNGTKGSVPEEKWVASEFTVPQVLLFHVNYIIRNGQFRTMRNKNHFGVSFANAEAEVSRG